jgi:DNA-binding NtrC family response regulator
MSTVSGPAWPTPPGGASDETTPRAVEPLSVPRLELIVQVEGGKRAERRVTLEGEVVRIGSHPSNEVVLVDRRVSRFHCRVTRTARGWAISDTGSLNGTRVNGVAVRDADLEWPECRIEVGASVVIARDAGHRSVQPSDARDGFGALLGASPPMRRMFRVLERAAGASSPVLIEGESGTGKELVAAEIVRRGARADRPLVVVDCASIAHNLVESQIFGHARGAFTGAERSRAGAFEAAAGGTVFLDEIGELPLDVQPKLLRVLESGEVRRVGENRHRKIDVRILAATHRDLEREVNRGRFREDLFFRVSVLTVRVPPLRDRREDIPLLVDGFLTSHGAADQRARLTPEVMEALARHDWPGNVRELRNFVERLVVLDAEDVEAGDPPIPSVRRAPASTSDAAAPPEVVTGIERPFRAAKDEAIRGFERAYLQALLRWAEGNVSRAARQAKMDRIHLHRLLQRHGLGRTGSLLD